MLEQVYVAPSHNSACLKIGVGSDGALEIEFVWDRAPSKADIAGATPWLKRQLTGMFPDAQIQFETDARINYRTQMDNWIDAIVNGSQKN